MANKKAITPKLSCLSCVKRDKNNGKRPPVKDSEDTNRDIELVFDRSGSMFSLGTAPIDSVKQFVADQRQLGGNTRITITTFDDKAEIMPGFDGKLISEVPEVDEASLIPRGCTRLIDTMMERLKSQEERCKSDPHIIRVFAVLTDGMDNMSFKYTARDLHQMITKVREQCTTCIFLASNQDAITAGASYGFSPDTSLTFGANAVQTHEAMYALRGATMRAFSQQTPAFTHLERQRSAPAPPSPPAQQSVSSDDSVTTQPSPVLNRHISTQRPPFGSSDWVDLIS